MAKSQLYRIWMLGSMLMMLNFELQANQKTATSRVTLVIPAHAHMGFAEQSLDSRSMPSTLLISANDNWVLRAESSGLSSLSDPQNLVGDVMLRHSNSALAMNQYESLQELDDTPKEIAAGGFTPDNEALDLHYDARFDDSMRTDRKGYQGRVTLTLSTKA